MSGDKIFSQADAEQVIRLTREGKSIRQAAKVVEFAESTIHRHFKADEELREKLVEARRFALEMIGEDARAEMVRRAHDTDVFDKAPNVSQRALERLFDTYVPEAKQTAKEPEEESRAGEIAAALDRFTSLVVSLATGDRTAIAGGEPERRGESTPGLPVAGMDSTP